MALVMFITTQGLSVPDVVCDHCNEVISDARTGRYWWIKTQEGENPSAIWFLHKRCEDVFVKLHPPRVWQRWENQSLLVFPLFLERRLAVPRHKASRLVTQLVREKGSEL